MSEAEDLLDTKAGMALANSAWQEGASAMLRSINQHTSGPWQKPTSPYSAPLLRMLNAGESSDFETGAER